MDAAYLIEPKVGYILNNRFGATTFEEFKPMLIMTSSIKVNARFTTE